MKKVQLITPEIGKDRGGIQNWMYFVKRLLKLKGYSIDSFSYKSDSKLKFLTSYQSDFFILATWKMSIFILPLLLTKKKIFIFVHGNEILNVNIVLRYLLKYLIRRKYTYFISNSKSIADLFFKTTQREVDLIQYPFMEISKQKVTKENNKFFTITRLVKRKNIANVIYALKRLSEENFVFNYTIAGDGPERVNLKNLVHKLHLEERINLIGKVDEEEKKELYQKSSYFLLPSIFDESNGSIEGYGIVFIEANSYKIPVLSGNTGGMLEAVENSKTGLHCDGTIDDIYLKIKKLLSINFDEGYIFDYALKHDYLSQDIFLNFIKNKINE